MHKSIVVSLLVAVAAFAFPARHLAAGVMAPNELAPGFQYQLIFVTADGTAGSDPVIGDYNAFAAAQAAESSSPVVAGATWSAVVSTADTDAINNAPASGLYPIYNTRGQLVKKQGVSLYGSALLTPVLYDQFGAANSTNVWTGTDDDQTPGRGRSGLTLGDDDVIYGESSAMDSYWLATAFNYTRQPQPLLYPIYALSGPITSPVPEPSSLVLLGFAAIGVAVVARRGMRRRGA